MQFVLVVDIPTEELTDHPGVLPTPHEAAMFVSTALDFHCQGTVSCEVVPLTDI